MTKFQLFMALTTKGAATISFPDHFGVTGILQSVQREDGSGSSFNVTILRVTPSGRNVRETYYVRTID
jgi:hypothetical protein